MTRLTVNLTPTAGEAMNLAAEFEEISKTDVVNRALQLYAAVVTAPTGTELKLPTPVGEHLRLIIPAVQP